MSAILKQFIKRGAVLYVRQQRRNICVAMVRPRQILQKNVQSVTIGPRLFSDAKEPSHTKAPENKGSLKDVNEEMKPTISRSIYDKLVRSNKVVVFMKGTPKSPRCGFSNAVVQIFRMHGVNYDAHDVLADDEIRDGIKTYTDWPTIPQVFINGEFVGGCDILLEMHQSGELVEELQKAGITSQLLRMEQEIHDKEVQAKRGRRNEPKKEH